MLDASVWVALGEPEERFTGRRASSCVDSASRSAALDLTLYEVANAVGVKRGKPRRRAESARR